MQKVIMFFLPSCCLQLLVAKCVWANMRELGEETQDIPFFFFLIYTF